MMRAVAFLVCLLAVPAHADWQFSQPVEVGSAKAKKLFHHLESANRKGLAESGGRVALAWEDNRLGEPRCWLAVREPRAAAFSPPRAITAGECYEPVVQGMGGGRFVTAWEESGAVWIKLSEKGHALKLSREEAAQVTLARLDEHILYAAWAEQAGAYRRIMIARLALDAGVLKLEYSVPLEDRLPDDDQAYPALAANADGSVLAVWEDRRFKHTAMLAARGADGKHFAPPYRLIDVPRARSRALGAGMGSMRPTLAACGATCLVALWLDKRDFLSGYDVYAAFSQNGGGLFGSNFRVQDSFGENVAQWHASIAANQAGRIVAVWDDDRDGAPDVWLGSWNGKEFSDNLAVPGAAGPGTQSDPVIHLDAAGMLHLAWLERTDSGGTRLKYASAVWRE
jgi:hypothetical protein